MSVLEAVKEMDTRQWTLLAAGMATIGAFHVTSKIITEHLKYWNKPREQLPIIFIVLMVPIFAVDSYVGLAEMPDWELYVTLLDSVKECYEAFVIANFLRLMYSYMNVSPDPTAPLPDAIKGRVMHHSFPVSIFQGKEVIIDKSTLKTLTAFTSQFVIIRPLFSLLLCFLELTGMDTPPLTYLFPIVFNISIYLAIYALLQFFHTFAEELAPHNPLAKFLCIKGVVFFAFWQGLIVQLLALTGVIHEGHFPYSVKQIDGAIQNFLVCFEMFFFALAFQSAFSAEAYNPAREGKEKSMHESLRLKKKQRERDVIDAAKAKSDEFSEFKKKKKSK